MSLKLKFDGITDWKIGNDYFRRGSFSFYHSASGAYVRAGNTSQYNFWTAHAASGGGLVLDMGPRVWVDAWVWDGLQFSRGGYLEEVEHRYDFSNLDDGNGGTEDWHVRPKGLGIRAATYAGGVKIEGIASPPNSWTDVTAHFPWISTGKVYYSYSQSFVWNRLTINITNWQAVNIGSSNSQTRMSAMELGGVENDINWWFPGMPNPY